MFPTVFTRNLFTFSMIAALGLAWASQAQPKKPAPGAENRPDPRRFIGPIDQTIPKHAPGEVVVRLAPGIDARVIAARFGLTVKRRLRYAPRTYVFSGVQTAIEQMVEALKSTPGVQQATANIYARPASLPTAEPNDPFRRDQWALRQLGASNVWGITVGERLVSGPRKKVLVGVIDFGPQTSHPDLRDNIDPNGFDFILDQPYDENDAPITLEPHGTAVTSCVAAVNNNFEGIAALPWEGVKVLPCHVGDFITVNNVQIPVIALDAAVDALYYCIERDTDVVNMSFVTFFDNPFLRQAVLDVNNQGILMTAASGNFRFFGRSFFGVNYPAKYDEVIAVGATGPNNELAFYSDGGPELDLMAPGGNDSSFFDPSRLLLLADSSGFAFLAPPGYRYDQGTSFACAYVAGAIAMLITQGAVDESLSPTEQANSIRTLLRVTARSPFGRRTDDFGDGIINVDAALKRTTHYIDLVSPAPNEVTQSFSEPLVARIVQPVPHALQSDEFTVSQNGRDVSSSVTITDAASGSFEYEPTFQTAYSVGNNTLNVTAESAVDPTLVRSLEGPAVGFIPARAYRFRVSPHIENAGLKMMSVPYELQANADTLPFLYGGNLVRLARWLPDQRRYAIFDIVGSPQDAEAALTTRAAGVARPPVGIGFWARVISQTQVQLFGKAERAGLYEIPVKKGFNLIGNPYAFRVPWNVVNVRFGNEVLSITEAARRGLVSSAIWRYQDGRYTFQVLPNGELVDWEGHWVLALQDLTLIVPRVPSVLGRDASPSATKMASEKGAWRASLRASADGKLAGEVFIGENGRARAGYGPEDVAAPPPAAGPLDLRIRHSDWGRHSGRYAQDLRPRRSGPQTWRLEVVTSRPGTVVKLAWDRLPSAKKGFLRIDGGRGLHTLTGSGSIQFRAANPGVHTVQIVAVPA